MGRRRLLAAAVVLLAAGLAPLPAPAADPWVKHVDVPFTMDDGVTLVADVYLPASGQAPYPCVVELGPYRKETRAAEGASFLPGEGIALIEVDARGTGGSGGEYDIVFSMREQLDTARVVDQAATLALPGIPDVCNDKVGMYGGSYSGIIQYLVATLPPEQAPRHLAAIAPQRAYGDLYRDIVYHGGQLIGSFGTAWSSGTSAFYLQPPTNAHTPQGASAWLDHLTKNDPMMRHYIDAPFADATYESDDTSPSFRQRLYEDSSPLSRVGNMTVPSLHLAGWFDAFTRGQLLMFEEALAQEAGPAPRGPNYLVVGPWNHANTHFITPEPRAGLRAMLAEWYRHWLDDAPAPAFMRGPRVQYYVMGSGAHLDATGEWRGAPSWPLSGVEHTRYYLREGGRLSPGAPAPGEAPAAYVANPTAGTAEIASRWDNAAFGAAYRSWDQRSDAPKGLSYTTEPFARDVRLAGTMNLHLRATTIGANPARPVAWPGAAQMTPPYHDTDFVVKVSDVAPDGSATLITQGYLRASHRALDADRSEFAANGDVVRAVHPHTFASLSSPGPQSTYEIEIWPTAKTFRAGHALRLDVYSADTPNHFTLLKPALNIVHHEQGFESWLLLPVLPE